MQTVLDRVQVPQVDKSDFALVKDRVRRTCFCLESALTPGFSFGAAFRIARMRTRSSSQKTTSTWC